MFTINSWIFDRIIDVYVIDVVENLDYFLAHVIKQPNLQIPNLQHLQLNFCFDFFNDSENTFWGFFEI